LGRVEGGEEGAKGLVAVGKSREERLIHR
jgi:hypothetical protein